MRTRILVVLAAIAVALTLNAVPASAAAKTVTLYTLQNGDCGNTVIRVLSLRKVGAGNECGSSLIASSIVPDTEESYVSERKIKRRLSKTGGSVTGTIYIRSVPIVNLYGSEVPNGALLPDLVGYADVIARLRVNGVTVGQIQFDGLMTPTEPLVGTFKFKLPAKLKGKDLKSAVLTVQRVTSIGLTAVSVSGPNISRITLPVS